MPRRCRSCNAPIRFVPTAASGGQRSMPIDVDPTDGGTVEVIHGMAHVLTGSQLQVARRSGTRLYVHHKATCPAEQARKALKDIDTDTGMRQASLL